MRIWIVAALALLAAPALAQDGSDGAAIAAGATGAAFEQQIQAGVLTRGGIREVIRQMLPEGVNAAERDLLLEIADGKPFTLTIEAYRGAGARTISVPASADDVAMVAKLVATPPNLHQLWCQPGLPTEQFVELSRISPATFQRMYTFVGNQLDDAWGKSTLINAFSPYVSSLGCQWKAMETLPADVEMRTAAYDLLTTGIAFGIEKAKGEGKTPPQDFLFAWVANEDTKAGFINGQPKAP